MLWKSAFSPAPFVRRVLPLFLLLAILALAERAAEAQVTFTGAQSILTSFPTTDSISPIATDSRGDSFFVVSTGSANVLYELPAIGTITVLNNAFPYLPSAIAVDGPGAELYFIHYGSSPNCTGSGFVFLATAPVMTGSTPTDLPCSFSISGYTLSYTDPTGLALDGAGNLYVADFGGGEIYKLPAPLSAMSVPKSLIALQQQPYDIAVGPGGALYYTALDYNNNSANTLFSVAQSAFTSTLPAGPGASTAVIAGLPSIQSGLVVDAVGDIYVGGGASPAVMLSGSTLVPIFSGFPEGMSGLGVDEEGDLFLAGIASSGKSEVVRLDLAAVNLGARSVGQSSSNVALNYLILSGTDVAKVSELTLGVAGKDFQDAGGSTCLAQTYSKDTVCSVNVHMTAKVPGLRTGAVLFADGSGNPLSTVPLYGVGLAPQVGFQTAAPVLLASGLNEPLGLRVDSAGNTYIADAQNARVLVVAPGGTQSTIGTGFAAPADVVLDGAGNFYVSDIGNQVVYKIAPSGTQTTAVSGLSFPYGLSLDGAGNLYISEALDGILLKVSPGGVRTLVASGLGMNYTNAVDVAGNVYTGDFTSGNIYKISPGGVQTTIGNLTNVTGLALDAAGDLYADSFGSGTISRIPPGGVPETIVSGLTGPYGITMDTTGNLFITEYLANTANKLSLTTSPVLNFATTAGGGTSSDSPMAATVVNIGNAPLVFSSVLYPADFPKDAAGNATACTGTTMLAPALTCTLTVDFKPVSLSGTSTSLALSEQATFKSNNLNLTGIGGHLVLTGTETKLIPTVMLSAAMKTVGTTSELALTARATGSGPVPGGLVTFQAGGVTVGTATLTPTGAAVLTTARPTLRHTFTAITAGDAVYASGKSNGVVINPTDASPAVVLSSSANPASKGSLVTFTATVSTAISGVPPTGNVQFTISGAVLATVSVSGGQASYSTSSLGVGSHTVVATYLGDANYLPTASNSVKQSITPTN